MIIFLLRVLVPSLSPLRGPLNHSERALYLEKKLDVCPMSQKLGPVAIRSHFQSLKVVHGWKGQLD